MHPAAAATMKARNEGSGLFGFLTALVTLYYTSVMMENLEVALGAYVGPSMAIILVTIFALFYQQRRSVKEFEQGGNYTMLEQTVTTLTDNGERVEIPVEQGEGRFNVRSMMFVYLIYAVLVGPLKSSASVSSDEAIPCRPTAPLGRPWLGNKKWRSWLRSTLFCGEAFCRWPWWSSAWPRGPSEPQIG